MTMAMTIAMITKIRHRLIMPTISIDLSTLTVCSRWGTISWSMDVVMGVNWGDIFREGMDFSRAVALNFVEKLK